jgi:hypothetical protein
MMREPIMSMRLQSKSVLGRKHGESVAAEDAAVGNDVWAWGVIFTTAALTALCVATLFCVGTG